MAIVERVKSVLFAPETVWQAIDPEPGDPAYLFTKYVAILAAIPAVCAFIGTSIVGVNMPVVGTFRVGIVAGLVGALIRYLLAFVAVYVVALVTDLLAPIFRAQKSQPNALKLAVYSMTPVWVLGLFELIPAVRILEILGVYGFYLFWLGTVKLMKAPWEKSLPYAVAVTVCEIAILLAVGAIMAVTVAAIA